MSWVPKNSVCTPPTSFVSLPMSLMGIKRGPRQCKISKKTAKRHCHERPRVIMHARLPSISMTTHKEQILTLGGICDTAMFVRYSGRFLRHQDPQRPWCVHLHYAIVSQAIRPLCTMKHLHFLTFSREVQVAPRLFLHEPLWRLSFVPCDIAIVGTIS